MNILQKSLKKIKSFFATTKLGHQIKSFVVTFTGIFFGMLVLTPAFNAVFSIDLPTITELKDLYPVLLDTFYRSAWTMVLIQMGIYKYSSSDSEVEKPVIIPVK
jgi:hypothetical protein